MQFYLTVNSLGLCKTFQNTTMAALAKGIKAKKGIEEKTAPPSSGEALLASLPLVSNLSIIRVQPLRGLTEANYTSSINSILMGEKHKTPRLQRRR